MAVASGESTIELAGRRFAPYIPAEVIDERTAALAEKILADYQDRPLHFVHIALGGVFWATDLTRAVRRLNPGVTLTQDLLRLRSRGQAMTSSGTVRHLSGLGTPDLIANRDVIIVDEVVDSGLTLSDMVRRMGNGIPDGRGSDGGLVHPRSVAIASLTDKVSVHNGRVKVNYPGFEVPDAWLVGRGMDHEEQGRELVAIYRSAMPGEPEPVPFSIPQTSSPFGIRPAV